MPATIPATQQLDSLDDRLKYRLGYRKRGSVDGCTMVFTTEYIPTDGSFNWATCIVSFKLSTCQ